MTKDQLLIPRYLCTGTPGKPIWPGSLLMSGDILTARFDNYGEDYYYTASCDSRYGKELKELPHLFRPMPWWEGRQPEDMPEYLRGSGGKGDVFFKVLQWRLCTDSLWQWINSTDCDTFYLQEYCTYQPSTSEEYEEFLKQKEGS